MSDDWEVDEEITRQHSRELNEQIGREHSAELDKQRQNAWPPEGTRVRIVGTLEHGRTGRLVLFGKEAADRVRWVVLDEGRGNWPVQRHEIEVIDGER